MNIGGVVMERTQKIPPKAKAFMVCLLGAEYALDAARGQVFDGVKTCLERMRIVADLVLLTSLNVRSAYSEWNFHSLPPCTAVCIKRRELAHCVNELLGRGYDRQKVLVVGFGPQCLAAAEKNGVLFYPILPGQEAVCWHSLEEEALPKLLHGTYAGDYQQRLMARHTAALALAGGEAPEP
ncbi:hypothetical protein B5G38_01045 [Gemmiger sp. An87]|nr:hypothetical protein B5G38_01045 [Gemmiger sp. An87]